MRAQLPADRGSWRHMDPISTHLQANLRRHASGETVAPFSFLLFAPGVSLGYFTVQSSFDFQGHFPECHTV